jgi:hypothetical protein
VLTTCQPSTVWCSRERLPAAAAQPAQGSSEPVAPRKKKKKKKKSNCLVSVAVFVCPKLCLFEMCITLILLSNEVNVVFDKVLIFRDFKQNNCSILSQAPRTPRTDNTEYSKVLKSNIKMFASAYGYVKVLTNIASFCS